MNPSQQKLGGMGESARPARRNDDYVELFEYAPGMHLFPIGDIDILERSNNLLIIKSYEWGRLAKMPRPHQRIFKMLVQFGESADARGSITILCVEGLGAAKRRWQVIDHTGEGPIREGHRDDFRALLRDWFRTNRRHR
jgi:hypothetical protein